MALLHEERESRRPNNYSERKAYREADMLLPRIINKDADRVALEKQIHDFLASGGKIIAVETSGWNPTHQHQIKRAVPKG